MLVLRLRCFRARQPLAETDTPLALTIQCPNRSRKSRVIGLVALPDKRVMKIEEVKNLL